jgi:hypothetical protein
MKNRLASAERQDGTTEEVAKEEVAIRIRDDVSLHFLGGGGILLDADAQKIYRFDRFSTLVWCLLAECRTIDRVKRRLVQAHGLSREAASRNVDIALADWRRQGLLGDGSSSTPAAQPPDPAPAVRTDIAEPGLAPAHRLGLRIAGLRVGLDIHAAMDPQPLREVFAHLAIGSDRSAEHRCALFAEDDGYCFVAEGRILAQCAAEPGIVPMVKAGLAALASEAVDAPAAIHAAALVKDGLAILLPGAAGAGKSTLAAALVHDGFDLAGDDTVFLSAEGHLQPMPFAICLKDKAWPVLAGRVREIDSLTVHRRADGQIVRYVLPRRDDGFAMAMDPLPIGAVIFPRFQAGQPPACRRLSSGEALERLLPQVFPKTHRFDADLIERLIALLGEVDLFAVTYGNLDGAITAFRQAVA